jgi:hypothetical protein
MFFSSGAEYFGFVGQGQAAICGKPQLEAPLAAPKMRP